MSSSELRRDDFLLYVIARPLMFIFWTLIAWGTFYGFFFLGSVASEGLSPTFQRATSSRASLGLVSMFLSASACIVWTLVGVAVVRNRRRRKRRAVQIAAHERHPGLGRGTETECPDGVSASQRHEIGRD